MTRRLRPAVAALLLLAGCATTDPGSVDLNGTWHATVNALEIGSMTLTLVDRNSELAGTGQWIPSIGGSPLTLTARGLHFGVDLNLTFQLSTGPGITDFSTQGRVEDEHTFHLVFPSVASPTRVEFRRQ